MSAWPEHAVWWQLHPLSFVGAEDRSLPPDAEPVHRLPRITGWLDYLVELGCNGLALGPVFASGSHGYDTVDHLRIDRRLGTDDDFDALVAACHRRGVRVLLDGVFNHVGRGFGAFQEVLADGASSPYASWFRLDFDADGPDGFGYATFEGHGELVALNHDHPAVADHVCAVMDHWLQRGADGWRLDAAYAVPHAFWRSVTDRVRADHPDVWFVGEMIHGDYVAAVRDGGLDSVTQYELWKAIWSACNDHNLFELAWALQRHDDFAAAFQPLTFVGNHDVTRIASRLDDVGHLPHALVVLLTLPGTPSIYAGDEQAFRGVKYEREGGDDEVRPAFPDTPDQLAADGWATYRLHQDLIAVRRRHPWLARAGVEVVHRENEALVYRVADRHGDAALTVVLNISDTAAVEPALDDPPGTRVLASDDRDDGPAHRVGPRGWAVLTSD